MLGELMMRDRVEQCGKCRFWDPLRDGDKTGGGVFDDGNYDVHDNGTGRCRRMPPTSSRSELPLGADAMAAAGAAYWPVTWDEDWCGEFVARLGVVG